MERARESNPRPKLGKIWERSSVSKTLLKSHRINGPCLFVCAHNPKVVSSNLTPATNCQLNEKRLRGPSSEPFRFLCPINYVRNSLQAAFLGCRDSLSDFADTSVSLGSPVTHSDSGARPRAYFLCSTNSATSGADVAANLGVTRLSHGFLY
jgi:hypothetical protein